ncbi:MAG TPA: ABC transporter substrate-binding protein [Burkholderiales bacterium]
MNASRLFVVAAAAVLAAANRLPAWAAPDEQFIPANYSAQGPSAAVASRMAAGMLDYLDMLNRRDGGVRGVRFTWEKCDTRPDGSRVMECYELARNHRPSATLVHPLTTAATYALIERATADRVPLVSVGYGRADSADGRVFPYVFPLLSTAWAQSAAIVRYLGMRAGGNDKLRGKRIVLLYSDSADGKDAIPVLSALAARYGYTLSTLAVPVPGSEQHEQWLKIREIRPDWIIVCGSQAMAQAALENAASAGFPRSRIVAGEAAGAAGPLAGAAAQGLVAAAFTLPGDDFPVIREIRRRVYDAGGGELREPAEIGSLHYNRGVAFGILTAEAVRVAQAHFNPGKTITPQQAQWGLEHLNLDEARLEALGAKGLMPPVQTSCVDHEGSGSMRFMRWDGKRWRAVTDWLAPHPDDRPTVRRMYAESAAAYAKGKGIEIRNCHAG